ncbi:MAG: peroxide stress protein YaaA, partial [Myxococcota bacterium]
MLAIVSPAKKLDTDTLTRSLSVTQPDLLSETERLITTTRKLQPSDLQRLMGISENLATLNHDRFQQFQTP